MIIAMLTALSPGSVSLISIAPRNPSSSSHPCFAHQILAQIGDGAAAEAQSSREQEDPEQRQQARMEIGLTLRV